MTMLWQACMFRRALRWQTRQCRIQANQKFREGRTHGTAKVSSAPGDSEKCQNCGHVRKDHSLDNGCWVEVTVGSKTTLCTCGNFVLSHPEKSQENKPGPAE